MPSALPVRRILGWSKVHEIDPQQTGDHRCPRDEGPRSTPAIPSGRVLGSIYLLAIFSGTLFLRAFFIGGPPFTDEGIYAFNAEMAWGGARAFPMAPINFYPSLVRWVGMPPLTPLLCFRIADGFVAAGAAAMLFVFLSRWAGSPIAFVMASAWSIASNLPLFADAGFKNSIMAATLVYLLALRLLSSRRGWAPFTAGLLIPLAVFLREPFFPIVIVSVYLCAALHGRRGLIAHVAGMVVAGCALLLWLSLFRGRPGEVLGYYREDLPMIYSYLATMGRDDRERWSSLGLLPDSWSTSNESSQR
jgi:hypothetical protein